MAAALNLTPRADALTKSAVPQRLSIYDVAVTVDRRSAVRVRCSRRKCGDVSFTFVLDVRSSRGKGSPEFGVLFFSCAELFMQSPHETTQFGILLCQVVSLGIEQLADEITDPVIAVPQGVSEGFCERLGVDCALPPGGGRSAEFLGCRFGGGILRRVSGEDDGLRQQWTTFVVDEGFAHPGEVADVFNGEWDALLGQSGQCVSDPPFTFDTALSAGFDCFHRSPTRLCITAHLLLLPVPRLVCGSLHPCASQLLATPSRKLD